MALNVHTIGDKAKKYILEHGGKIVERDTDAYDVEVPNTGLIALGGYTYHGGNTRLWGYEDGTVLDFTVETGDHRLKLIKQFKTGQEAKDYVES